MVSPVPSQYPTDAVEVTVTFLIDMTGEKRDSDKYYRVLGAALDAAQDAGGMACWTTSDYVRSPDGAWQEKRYKRPAEFARPRSPRRKP